MLHDELIGTMVERLQGILDEENPESTIQVTADSPLIGPQAVVSSLGLVSYIADVESIVAEDYGTEVVLVNEVALSRRNSPFRTVETMADYVMELLGEPIVSEESVPAQL